MPTAAPAPETALSEEPVLIGASPGRLPQSRGTPAWGTLLLCLGLGVALALGGAPSCSRSRSSHAAAASERPDVRLLFVSGVAGALEPCGCRKDMLGGADHAAAWLDKRRGTAQSSLLLGAGPMLFPDPQLPAERRTQDLWKAEALATSLRAMGLQAWAPGLNDYAAGVEALESLRAQTGAELLAAGVHTKADTSEGNTRILLTQPLRVGVVGIGVPPPRPGSPFVPNGQRSEERQAAALRQGLAQLHAQGAQLRVALVAAQRGQALRLAEKVPGFHVLAVGNAKEEGDSNEPPVEPTYVGSTLVVQPPNHLQGIAQVDVFVHDGKYDFADGSGLRSAEQLDSLRARRRALSQRLETWKSRAPRSAEEIQQQSVALEALQARLRQAEDRARAPHIRLGTQSALFYELAEVVEGHGESSTVAEGISRYYRRVNDHNRQAFKDRTPAPVPDGQAGYVGVERCGKCHQAAAQFWSTTRHASAYATLSDDHKQFNLDCVGCHVTGYSKPGGTTVTHVEGLTDVQCEACHGPGSRHVAEPADKRWITRSVEPATCRACHHEPHVASDWNVARALPLVLGPGHGLPATARPASGE